MKITIVFVLVLATIVLAEDNHHQKRHDSHEKSSGRSHQKKHANNLRHHDRSHNKGHNRNGHGSGHQGRASHHQNRAPDANETTTAVPLTSLGSTEAAIENNTSTSIVPIGSPPKNSSGPVDILPLPLPLPDPMREWIQFIMKQLGDNFQCLNQLSRNLSIAIRGSIREPLFPERRVTLLVNETIVFNVKVHFGISCSNADQENAPNLLGQIQQGFNNLWENLTCGGQIVGNVVREIAGVFLRNGALSPMNIILIVDEKVVYNATLNLGIPSCTVPTAQPRSSRTHEGRRYRRH